MDLGCGTSAVGSVLVAKFNHVNISLVDFSVAACLYQQSRIESIFKHYKDRTSEERDLLKDNNITLGEFKSLEVSCSVFFLNLDS